ncbi:acyl carrier protein [Nocardiopsis sp. MG754419]|uniref:acyl carrier protein n=1 Tax=Nocardiopsis sp. MG754419 TaxID=2259865 RepID=UPI001BA7B9BD|nr:phosphopantetheine-binding protein [Nocardiopsis sp. MG754419]MBR8743443.1 acyl carrier protein [Nocardiopsis sp. MG754419]
MVEKVTDPLILFQRAIEDVTGIPAAEVAPEKTLAEDLELDSLSLVEVVFALQKATGCALPEEELVEANTVEDLVRIFRENSENQ